MLKVAESTWLLVALAVATLGCKRLRSLGDDDSVSTPAPPSGSASASPKTAAMPSGRATASGAACQSSERKVWTKWANRRTGITAADLGVKIALGVGYGNHPKVIVFDRNGRGSAQPTGVSSSSPLAKDIPAKLGKRDLQRVTPTFAGGRFVAYADYRDKYKDGRRRIACERVNARQPLLVFDGMPLLKRKENQSKSEAVAKTGGRLQRPALGTTKSKQAPAPSGRAILGITRAPKAPVIARQAPVKRRQPLREIRDCRTIVDKNGSLWGVGSELVGKDQGDRIDWTMRLFVAPDGGRGYVTLTSRKLPDNPRDPKDLHTLEGAVGHTLENGNRVVLGRYRGSLLGFTLSKGFARLGRSRTYRSGYPSLPRFFSDNGGAFLFTSQRSSDKRWHLATAGIADGSLPHKLSRLTLPSVDSASEPSLAVSKGRRFVSFQQGERRKSRLMIVPVGADLTATGTAHAVSDEGREVYESQIFGLSDGRLLAVYIQSASPGAELVSEILSCPKTG